MLIPKGVRVLFENSRLEVHGPKGGLAMILPDHVELVQVST